MTLGFLFGGGRQQHGATLTLWRVWPRWSTPVVLAVACLLSLTLLTSGLPLTVVVAGQALVVMASIAALLRAIAGWTGLPARSVMIGDVANAGDPGAGRELLRAVCAEADRRDWTLALAVRPDRTTLVRLYLALMFVPVAERDTRVIMVRPAHGCSGAHQGDGSGKSVP